MVLADPGFVVAELVQPLDQFEIALQRKGRVLIRAVEWGEEDPESHSATPRWSKEHSSCGCVEGRSTLPRLPRQEVANLDPDTECGQTGLLSQRSPENRTHGGSKCRRFGAILASPSSLFV